MLSKKNLEILENQKNIRDIIILGRFSDDSDDNEIIMYGFADPEWEKNRRILKYHPEMEEITLSYTRNSEIDSDLVEPNYPAMRIVNDFVVAGNGLQTARTGRVLKKYRTRLAEPSSSILAILEHTIKERYPYRDINGNMLYVNSFKPDRMLTPRIQGVLYAPYLPGESSAAITHVKDNGLCRAEKRIVPVPLERNMNSAKIIATFYNSGKLLEVPNLNISGWEKDKIDARAFQKELTDLIFESLGENAVGVASILGYPKHKYVINRINE
jgi:hypothetical protein